MRERGQPLNAWIVGVDIGGTFTDVVAAEIGTGDVRHLKVSSSRDDPSSAVISGIEALRDDEESKLATCSSCCTEPHLPQTLSSNGSWPEQRW